jgi:preprotein translocase subunit SecA
VWERRTASFDAFFERHARMAVRAEALAGAGHEEICSVATKIQKRLRFEECSAELLEESFALVAAAIKLELGFTAYAEQCYAGWLIYHGLVAEMQTGEGKTLTAAFPACTAALAGVPVHVITANDYLVERDAGQLRAVYETLGLSVSTIVENSSESERHAAYAADVTYVSNQQLVFDYLKDRQAAPGAPWTLRARLGSTLGLTAQQKLQRGLCFAIVDEADSVLIDDARTPLVLSKASDKSLNHAEFAVALGVARRLEDGHDFTIEDNRVELTEVGEAHLAEVTSSLPARWKNSRYRDEMACQGLTALYLLKRNEHYIVRDDKIVLIDENTGRAMPDRSLSHGLHQVLQVKEGCAVTAPNETIARISYQRFFRKYLRLGGMTGTANEARREFINVYGLGVKRVPTHRPCLRVNAGVALFASMRDKYQRLVEVVREASEAGRPVLIGTRSVNESEQVSRVLEHADLACVVLNAANDQHEADVVAQAGQPGRIVVATNMAGRGTDIKLHASVAAVGGMHVVSTQLNDSQRIDRQLSGRCARQGDPGSHQMLLSLEDEIFRNVLPEFMRLRLIAFARLDTRAWPLITQLLVRAVQRVRSNQTRRLRKAVRRADQHMDDLLAFGAEE